MKSYNELYECALMKFKDVYQNCEYKHDVECEIGEIIKDVLPLTVGEILEIMQSDHSLLYNASGLSYCAGGKCTCKPLVILKSRIEEQLYNDLLKRYLENA